MKHRRLKYLMFAAAAVLLPVGTLTAVLLAADMYAHQKADRSAGLNRWGYRGPVVGRKKPGETRVVVVGGSTAYGYGVTWDEAFPAQLERLLQERRRTAGDVSVVNLAYNNEGAYSFRFTLDDYKYLQYDIAIFYEGYNDMMGESNRPNTSLIRHESPVFRLTGYYPILPLVLREKAMAIRYGGDLAAAYRDKLGSKTVFQPPSLARRTAGAAMTFAADVGDRIGDTVVRPEPRSTTVAGQEPLDGCQWPWRHYCRSIAAAADDAHARGVSVVVVGQPDAEIHGEGAGRHREQQQALRTMLQRRFGSDPGVRYVDLGGAVDLHDEALAYDGMHLTALGNRIIAQDLVEPILATIAPRKR